ncbi:hypothetical protein VNO78_30811 [Psophocarpus tetragonolobus]|uniref:EGF-like domain-containing protein n=1 Tax=Psophocarpus tetragonolobus TaxID=3891 RepID=A0AAN9RXJ0_PSOTE
MPALWPLFNIDECKTEKHGCISDKNCHNTDGSYECFCPKKPSGNGTKEDGCHQQDVVTKVIVGVGAGIIILFVGTSSLYLVYQKRKFTKLREKYFRQNGGSILTQKLSTRKNSSHFQIFTEEQLQKATNNFDENLIIGKCGFGTVFKGYLVDNTIVAVKKSKIVDKSQNEQFANEDRLLDILQAGIVNEENKKEIMEVAILAAQCLRLNGEERPSMKKVVTELERIGPTEKKHPWINTFENREETQHLLEEGASSVCELGDSSNYQYAGYDSINDHVQIGLDDGR